ncbi:MAG: hypothetical protein IPM60_12020 [Rhodospirillales bacterium]|nr:hypothetical protein [Rhodospirillales bacterium]
MPISDGMPFDTLESRWFFEASSMRSAPEVEAWFLSRKSTDPATSARETDPPQWRTDRYLVVPGTADIAIKLREGRFEVKGKVADLGMQTFEPGASGRIERWMKWSCDMEADGEQTRPRGGWLGCADVDDAALPVAKQRLMRTFHIGESPAAMAAAATEPEKDRLMDFELTRIRLGDAAADTHWSLAFEASPYGPGLAEVFRRIAAELLRDWPGPPLGAEASMSYASWLSGIAERQAGQ